MDSLVERARNINAVVLDGDGVIFTGHVIEGREGPLAKIHSHPDGQGVSLLRAAGIVVACVTGESGTHASFLQRLVEKWNTLPLALEKKFVPVRIFTGAQRRQKVAVVASWLTEHGLTFSACAAMGDDMTDYEILRTVGLAAAPQQAEEIIKRCVHFVAPRRGGHGAVRDLTNLILDAKGIDIAALALN